MEQQRPLCRTASSGDFAVRRAKSERASSVAPTQAEAIAEAYRLEPNATVLVACDIQTAQTRSLAQALGGLGPS
jgi:hypothetical protein